MTLRYRQLPGCETIVIDDEIMILNPDGYTMTKVNEVAGFCWNMLGDSPQSIGTLTAAVCEHYRVIADEPEAQVEQDVRDYIERLQECGLLAACE